ncbi:MAG: polyphosphate kinase 1 [Flavobacteriales bacterium]|nr:polyphosphate kinase 1 [Flavobacteriales bacterium]
MLTEELLVKARAHVRQWLGRKLAGHMRFHDLDHTLAVTRAALEIGRGSRLSEAQLRLVEVAALFHDMGYALTYAGHEAKSAELAEAFLSKEGASKRDIASVRALIMATRMSATPRGLVQQVLRDADTAKAGQADFDGRSERLRIELSHVRGREIGKRQWQRENLAYLEAHRFHTRYARQRFGPQKSINLSRLRERLSLPKKKAQLPGTELERFFDRDLSWLSFNERVLQEAQDPRTPLLERIKFLAIYSSNLDEFYRVRVASLHSVAKLGKRTRSSLEATPLKLVEKINRTALGQQQEFGRLFRGTLLPALRRKGIRILREDELDKGQLAHVAAFFRARVMPLLHTAAMREGNATFIEDRKLYFACRIRPRKGGGKARMVLVNIPSDEMGRFVTLPVARKGVDVIFLDDVIRLCLPDLFVGYRVLACHAIKVSRDAELHLEEEFALSITEKVRRSLRKRMLGQPARALYDSTMPRPMVEALRTLLRLKKADMVAGGRYHNFSDLHQLPIAGFTELRDRPLATLRHPDLPAKRTVFSAMRQGDILLHFPYHDYGHVLELLREASRDRDVRHIQITLYRVAADSKVCELLLEALARGKQVTAFVEVQARFDERTNLQWGEALEKAGARVMYSHEGLKVHAKLLLIERGSGRRTERFAYLGTGNFHERTARLYADCALLTTDPELTQDVAEVFRHVQDLHSTPRLKHILMAPMSLRSGLEALVDREIRNALSGRPAGITLKMNSLEDKDLIRKLYDASRSGVDVRLIIRGICCLIPGVRGMSERIEAISIVDRYLEHARVFVFHNQGQPEVFLSSADWMSRNVDRRIETAFPVRHASLRQELLDMLELQWSDTVKGRQIDPLQGNTYRKPERGKRRVRCQEAFHTYLARRSRNRR